MSVGCVRRTIEIRLSLRGWLRALWLGGRIQFTLHEHVEGDDITVICGGLFVPQDPPCVTLEVQ